MKLKKVLRAIVVEQLAKQQKLREGHYIGYHGSDSNIVGGFKNLNPNITGFFFSDDYENAKTYGGIVKKYKLRINNPLVINAKGLKFTDDIPVEVLATYPGEDPYLTTVDLPLDRIVKMVKEGKKANEFIEIKDREKYDGVIFKNIVDPALSSRRKTPQDTIVVFDNDQIEEIN